MKAQRQLNLAPARNTEFEKLCNVLRNRNIEIVAHKAGVHQSTLYFWLDGTTKNPHINTLARVAKVVGFKFKLVKA